MPTSDKHGEASISETKQSELKQKNQGENGAHGGPSGNFDDAKADFTAGSGKGESKVWVGRGECNVVNKVNMFVLSVASLSIE